MLFAGRVLKQFANMLSKLVSLQKQLVVLSGSRHSTTESKKNKTRQIYIYNRMNCRRDYSHETGQALCLIV